METRVFTKLCASILDSSMWQEDDATVRVWITLLAMADRYGFVWSSLPGLAHRARKSIAETAAALDKFRAPDPYSRSTDHEGRRLIDADGGGWFLLNFEKYRTGAESEIVRERKRIWAAKNRAKSASVDPGRLLASIPVDVGLPASTPVDSNLLPSTVDSVSVYGSDLRSSDPDPDPTGSGRITAGARDVEGITFDAPVVAVQPTGSRFPPDSFEPTDTHRVRCQELKLDIDALVRDFKAFEFNREYSDWPRRFSRWIERARLDAETASSRAASAPPSRPSAVGGSPEGGFRKRVQGQPGWVYQQHATLAANRGLNLSQVVREYRAQCDIDPDGLKPQDVYAPFLTFIEKRAQAPTSAPAGWQPNAKHVEFCRLHKLDVEQLATSYVKAGAAASRSLREANDDFGRRLIRVSRGQPFGFDLGVSS